MPAPRIFLSYASEDRIWVGQFKRYFLNYGMAQISDYEADAVPYGSIADELSERITSAAVIIAFVSSYYKDKKWTVAEWQEGLDEAAKGRLIFVPLILDADAAVWWQTLRREGRLSQLSRDYAYSNFMSGGRRALVGPDNPLVLEQINDLALSIRKDLETPAPPPPGGVPVVQQGQPVPPGPKPPAGQVDFVVLGHPTATLPPNIRDEKKTLIGKLGAAAVSWDDGWRPKEAVRAKLPDKCDPIFIQPIPETEADDYIENPKTTASYLEKLGRQTPRVAVWLPSQYSTAEFRDAAKVAPDSKYPVLRADTPQDLARWLQGEVSLPVDPNSLSVQVEGYGAPEGSKPEHAAIAKFIVDRLKTEMWNIVSSLVQKPRPASPVWQFWDTQFGRQIKILPGSRAIVAIHDLDIPQSTNSRIVQKKVELKFDRMQKYVDAEQEQRRKDGKPDLKMFWTALLVNHASALPFSNYPDDGRYKDWCLLDCSPLDEASNDPRPDPASLAVFRNNLLAWATS